ncbi:phospholipase C, phosphocholine-specific [Salinisphaera sp. USBA-960]|uniref:phosphocholine-specific phospholipase C n=1 Tax=Salinisphaera orenii TaxID=856731 RepID=UPI000DBEA040|nr:phospholipase C, phosphocholine-specific [Salifodinibacter halophilus]NNC25997.1 phospholipase C, phosphocholine-specific [Salifodinibacter halophilus]
MVSKTRREFLRDAGTAAGSAAALSAMPPGLRKAIAMPANKQKGSIEDVEHIVILMQENRSFDHYFGSLKGVRGFGDTRSVTLPNGESVWHQPSNDSDKDYELPFSPNADNLGMKFLEDLPHDWNTTQQAWNAGRYNQWPPVKGTSTMAYLQREDIPFHYQLADAFTICDAYHCSGLMPTDPNRYYMWTGWVGNDGQGGGPVITNAEAGYSWSTFPELLEQASITWKIYQDVGEGLDSKGAWGWTKHDPYIGTYACNSLLFFKQYQNAQPGDSLYERARRGTNVAAGDRYLDDLRHDVENNKLPQVSWIVSPEAFCEHPNWPTNYGAWYIDQVLQILTSNPEIWSKTALFITYDENDGYFDHVVPPFASGPTAHGVSTVDTTYEHFPGDEEHRPGPYGLGPRVPMLVVSPWSKGGYVCSEVFDHTSIIQFVEQRFGKNNHLFESQITDWRRSVCGDLTSAFDFTNHNADVPDFTSTSGYKPTDHKRHDDFVPIPPKEVQLPAQETGTRPARALPYTYNVCFRPGLGDGKDTIEIVNNGTAGVNLLLYRTATNSAPRSYTVEAGKHLLDNQLLRDSSGRYDISVHGPNGFLRHFIGSSLDESRSALPDVIELEPNGEQKFQLKLVNRGNSDCTFTVVNTYGPNKTRKHQIGAGHSKSLSFDLRSADGWYDFTITADGLQFQRHLAGHIETGYDSISDPALGRS